tara:strand:+ start:1730 stop:2014 length:285 start_codon:yes stop_codon:yes gene_type:complete
MYKLILTIILFTSLSSCATTRWEHLTKNQAESYLDLLHCKEHSSLNIKKYKNSVKQKLIKNDIDKCMKNKYGWIKKSERIRYYLPFPFSLFVVN